MRSLRSPVRVAADVSPADYARLLGYPLGRRLEGRARELAEASRDWFGRHGRAWTARVETGVARIDGGMVVLDGGRAFASDVLARRLLRASSPAVTVAAISAGPEVDERSEALWRTDRPDEAFFLDRFGASVAEHLATTIGEELRHAPGRELTALLGYSPGYDTWDLSQQAVVLEALLAGGGDPPGPLRLLESGMLQPKSSLLAVFGMTPDRALAEAAWARTRCGWCSRRGCDFRHLPAR